MLQTWRECPRATRLSQGYFSGKFHISSAVFMLQQRIVPQQLQAALIGEHAACRVREIEISYRANLMLPRRSRHVMSLQQDRQRSEIFGASSE